MMKFLLIVLNLTFFSGQVSAQVSATGGCVGQHGTNSINMLAEMSDKRDVNTAEGKLIIDGREVSRFNGADLRVNIFFKSFVLRNNHGDILEGKLKSLSHKTVNISRMYIPAYGINYKNVHVSCWSR